MRRTISREIRFRGVGLHSGRPATATVCPAAAGAGIAFRLIGGGSGRPIPARVDRIASTRRSTALANADGDQVLTVEHLLAALAGCGVTDAEIAVEGPEVPAMDGSALPFVAGLLDAGFTDFAQPLRAIRILEDVAVREDRRHAALSPAPRFEVDFTIDYAEPAIGFQRKALAVTGAAFVTELCDSRTFALLSEVGALHREGLGLGGSLQNTVVVDGDRVLNPGGLRHPDEFVRHKMLDAVGDLALAGAPVIGSYTGVRAGHGITCLLLRALFARPEAWTWVEATPEQVPGGRLAVPDAARLPLLAV